MKNIISRILVSPSFQNSLLVHPARWLIRSTSGFIKYSPEFRLAMLAIDRPHYAWCMLKAANLARRLGHRKISAIEFGVAGGNGLAFMSDFAKEVKESTGVEIECYGFDTGTGMPPPEGSRDLPYWFQAQQYHMDEAALRRRLPDAHLVLGDIKDSIEGFLEAHKPAPIGAVFNDTDYWSSTRESFRLFNQAKALPEHFLPRVFMYFDDIIGSDTEMYGPYNGQLLAMHEYNDSQEDVKIHLNQNLRRASHLPYRWQIYYAHLFAHKDYDTYVGAEGQEKMESLLKLKP
jgi:hypothetical protein